MHLELEVTGPSRQRCPPSRWAEPWTKSEKRNTDPDWGRLGAVSKVELTGGLLERTLKDFPGILKSVPPGAWDQVLGAAVY